MVSLVIWLLHLCYFRDVNSVSDFFQPRDDSSRTKPEAKYVWLWTCVGTLQFKYVKASDALIHSANAAVAE